MTLYQPIFDASGPILTQMAYSYDLAPPNYIIKHAQVVLCDIVGNTIDTWEPHRVLQTAYTIFFTQFPQRFPGVTLEYRRYPSSQHLALVYGDGYCFTRSDTEEISLPMMFLRLTCLAAHYLTTQTP